MDRPLPLSSRFSKMYLPPASSIDGGVTTVDELIGKCNILKDFKAVQEGQVYCTTNDMYQQSMAIGYLLQDMHTVLTDDDTAKLRYLFLLQ